MLFWAKLKANGNGSRFHKWINTNHKFSPIITKCQCPGTLNELPSKVKIDHIPKFATRICKICLEDLTYSEFRSKYSRGKIYEIQS